MSGNRPRQRRHLPDDESRVRARSASTPHRARTATTTARNSGKMGRPTPIAAAYGIDPLLFLAAAIQPAEDRERVRVLFRHQGRADRAVQHSDLTGLPLAGARRDHPGRPSLSGRNRRPRESFGEFQRLLRPSLRRDALPAASSGRATAFVNLTLTCALMADGAANEVRPVLGGAALRRHSGATSQKLGVPGIKGVCRSIH